MPPEESWLSCEVSEKDARQPRSVKPSIFISIPKKAVHLATDRNRIRRLIREATRKNSYFKGQDKVYLFRVLKAPLKPRLSQVQELLETVKNRPYPSLLAGDFNDNPGSKPIEEIKEKGYHNLLELASPNSLRITWDNQNPFIQTHSIQFPDREIDFLFASPEFLKLNPIKTCKIVFNCSNKDGIFPSDHYGVFAEIGS